MRKENPKIIIREDNIDEEKKKEKEKEDKHEKVTDPGETKQKNQKKDYINHDFFVNSFYLLEQYDMHLYANNYWNRSQLAQYGEENESNYDNIFQTNYKCGGGDLFNNYLDFFDSSH